MSASGEEPRLVLLTNDDGPPSAKHSPFIWGWYKHLTQTLGWNVKVVLPSSQKSWIGKAFHITEVTKGWYYYPTDPDGSGELCETSRPLREGEVAEWVLLDGTPATCANVAIHNLYPNQIDLVISGPNLGRNTSSAFSLSSGTLGAALSASLTGLRSIALSYGIVEHPSPPAYVAPAHGLGGRIVGGLWREWGGDVGGLRVRRGGGGGGSDNAGETETETGEREVDLYSVNIPLVPRLLTPHSLEVLHTTMWRNQYGRLFAPVTNSKPSLATSNQSAGAGAPAEGPDASPPTQSPPTQPPQSSQLQQAPSPTGTRLLFKFAPDMSLLIPSPSSSSITPNSNSNSRGTSDSPAARAPEGSDAWAIHEGYASVTALRAGFAEPPIQIAAMGGAAGLAGRKMKL